LIGNNAVRSLAEVISATNPFDMVTEIAQLTVSGVAEKGAYVQDPGGPSFGKVQFVAQKYGRLVKVSEELLNDAVFDIGSYITRKGAQGIANEEERVHVTEFLTNGTELSTGAAVSYDTVIDLLYGVVEGYRRNGTFLAADSTIGAIMKLKDTANLPIWNPAVVAGQPDTLRGRPIRSSQYMPANANGNKVLGFGAFGQCFTIADFGSPSVQRLNELYSENGQIGFRFSTRSDAHVTDARGLGWYRRTA